MASSEDVAAIINPVQKRQVRCSDFRGSETLILRMPTKCEGPHGEYGNEEGKRE